MKYLFVILFSLFLTKTHAHQYVNVIDENFVINSTTALSGYTRNKTEVTLPKNTISYIYRITISTKGNINQNTPLLTLLNNSGDITIAGLSHLSQYAINNSDDNAVDAFIFNNVYDANDFYSKRDQNWTACKSMANRSNCCFESSECINDRIFFGFRNNNISQGLNVRLEVIAKVEESALQRCSYTISNSTDTELKYFVSIDNINWKEVSLRGGYNMTYNNSLKELYFKIHTNKTFVNYRIFPGERYKIVVNKEKYILDLVTY